MVQTQKDLELSSKRRSISGVTYGKLCKRQFGEIYPRKYVKEAILIKTPRPENLDPVKKLDDYLQELLNQKKRPQDIVIDNTLEKVQDKLLDIMGPLSKLLVMIEQVNSGSGSSSTVEMILYLNF